MVDGSVVAEILEARKKKGKKGGSIPGPVIGYLMKKGVIGKGRKFKGKKRGVKRKSKSEKRIKTQAARSVMKGAGKRLSGEEKFRGRGGNVRKATKIAIHANRALRQAKKREG